ncbi:RnfH family protein [Limnohabitans sp. Rim8]|jgi:hypothetical protein|uniref:RnfH family protein n=1 Tax=Limnohabitans sp. Rim8 TaxID=1100718 RepID=UPI0025FC1AA3|nr:RnfH family protein [Limnohabitans sp. Rim8]
MAETPATVRVTLCWSLQARQVQEQSFFVPAGSSVQSVLEHVIAVNALSPSESAPLKFMQPGIWGRKVVWAASVQDGDRVELYRPLKVDPKVARRQRFKRQGKGRTGLFANRKSGSAAGY